MTQPVPELSHLEVGTPLGQGGMATVYEANDPTLQRSVALKVLHPALREQPEVVERFIAEARLAGRLQHPNVLTTYAMGHHATHGWCFTMRKVNGQTLHDHMRRHRRTPKHTELDELVDILVAVCDALAHAHEAGVVHGDIKSQNILLAGHGAVYLTDWGNARPIGSLPPLDARGLPEVLGTLALLSPEQARGEAVDERTDVFGVGTLLYTLLARRVPYGKGGPEARIDAAKVGRFAPLAEQAPKAPGSLRDIATRAMALDPDDRFQTASELRQALVDYRRRRVDAKVLTLAPGDILIREGDIGDALYIIDEGTFAITREDVDGVVAHCGPGEVLGEMGLLTQQTRTATVVAETSASVRRLDGQMVREELDRMAPWLRTLVKNLAVRIRRDVEAER